MTFSLLTGRVTSRPWTFIFPSPVEYYVWVNEGMNEFIESVLIDTLSIKALSGDLCRPCFPLRNISRHRKRRVAATRRRCRPMYMTSRLRKYTVCLQWIAGCTRCLDPFARLIFGCIHPAETSFCYLYSCSGCLLYCPQSNNDIGHYVT